MPDKTGKNAESEQGPGKVSSVPIQRAQIGTRVEAAAKVIGNRRQAAEQLEVSVDSLRRYCKGEISPDAEFLARLSALSGYSVGYIVTGREPIRSFDDALDTLREGAAEAAQHVADATGPYDEQSERFVYVARYDIEASTGGGSEVHSEQVVDYLAFRRDWIAAQRLKPENLALIETLGDSMEPTIEDGDLVLVDLARREIKRPGIYVLRRDSTLLAKRLELRWDADGVVVRSDNQAYDDQVLDQAEAEQLDVLGRVVWLGRRL